MPDRSDPDEPREQLAILTVDRMDGLRIDRLTLRLLDGSTTQEVRAMSSATAIVLAIFLLLGNAFFVGAEFALVSARRTQIEPRAEAGSRMATHHDQGDGEHLPGDRRQPARHHGLLARCSVPSASRRSPTWSSRCCTPCTCRRSWSTRSRS